MTNQGPAQRIVSGETRLKEISRYDGVTSRYGTYQVADNKLIRKDLANENAALEGQEVVQTIRFEGNEIVLYNLASKNEASSASMSLRKRLRTATRCSLDSRQV